MTAEHFFAMHGMETAERGIDEIHGACLMGPRRVVGRNDLRSDRVEIARLRRAQDGKAGFWRSGTLVRMHGRRADLRPVEREPSGSKRLARRSQERSSGTTHRRVLPSTHQDKLFRYRRMQGHRLVEVSFCGAHL